MTRGVTLNDATAVKNRPTRRPEFRLPITHFVAETYSILLIVVAAQYWINNSSINRLTAAACFDHRQQAPEQHRMQLQRIYARHMINEGDNAAAVDDNDDLNKQLVVQGRHLKCDSVEELDLALRSYQLPSAARRLWNQIQITADRQDEFMLGYHFDVGIRIGDELGMASDTNQAVFWYRRAAEKGHIIAQLNLGVLYETGHQGARERDYASAVDWYHRAALNGHQGAQFNLGRLFWSGKGVPQNLQTAFGFFKKAAKKGNHMAMTNIGAMYMSGNGVQQNAVEARRWSQLAAMKNNAVAHHNLGVMFENGMGGRTDPELAAMHFRQALDPTMEHPVSEMLSRDLRQSRDPLIFT